MQSVAFNPPLRLFIASACMSVVNTACESVDVGHIDDPESPPKLVRLLVQDEDLFGGRFMITDVLRDADPSDPSNACGDADPCPGELGQFCSIAEGEATGFCIDPLNPQITPPGIGTPVAYGGNQIRLVFDQGLDSGLDERLKAADDTTVRLELAGAVVEAVKYLDNSGSPDYSAIPIFEPFGPAIVLKPTGSLIPQATYTITTEASEIRDRGGQSLAEDSRGPYTFTMEGFYVLGATPDVITSTGAVLSQNGVIQLSLNAPVDEVLLSDVVTSSSGAPLNPPIDVRDGQMGPVLVRSWADRGPDPTACDAARNPRVINILRIAPDGAAIDWAPGSYTMTVASVEAEGSDAKLGRDASGTSFTTGFTVVDGRADPGVDPSARENFVLPENCE